MWLFGALMEWAFPENLLRENSLRMAQKFTSKDSFKLSLMTFLDSLKYWQSQFKISMSQSIT
jgi:hypothetical protein